MVSSESQGFFSQPQAAPSSSHEININRFIYPLCFCNKHTWSVLATPPIGMMGFEPITSDLEGLRSLHLSYIPVGKERVELSRRFLYTLIIQCVSATSLTDSSPSNDSTTFRDNILYLCCYPTSWGKKESNLRCFYRHGFTDRCNRHYAYFPKTYAV